MSKVSIIWGRPSGCLYSHDYRRAYQEETGNYTQTEMLWVKDAIGPTIYISSSPSHFDRHLPIFLHSLMWKSLVGLKTLVIGKVVHGWLEKTLSRSKPVEREEAGCLTGGTMGN